MRRFSVVLACALVAIGCGDRPVRSVEVTPTAAPLPATPAKAPSPPTIPTGDGAVLTLPIPARAQAAESPPSGWCGETAIQEGLLYLGVWTPQGLINKAGRPIHPDLYSPEIPVALTELGVRFSFYARARGYDGFAEWARTALEQGVPVLAGVKILPTEHPEWGLDHFVLVVGHGKSGLLVNTTWGTRAWVGDTRTKGLSLANAFYGIRLEGIALSPGALPARITLLEEGAAGMKMHVTCTGSKSGTVYRVERRHSKGDAKAVWSQNVTADADGASLEAMTAGDRPARFQCVPVI